MGAPEEAAPAADVEAPPAPPPKPPAVPFREVLRTADALDVVLMITGTICGAACGAVQPCFTLIFGSLVDTLGSGATMSESLRPVILWFCYLGAAASVAGYLEIACWEMAGIRQANRIRRQYLTALLRQEMAYFDTHDTGALLSRVVTDTNAIQLALSSKCPNLIHHGMAGVIGVIIGLIRGWQMALVVCATLPLMGGAGYIMAMSLQHWTKIASDSYADASAFAKEVISQMRVVAAFGGEARACEAYAKALVKPTHAAMQEARWAGGSLGIVFLAMFGTYGFALWYGSTLLLAGKYTGGQVMNVLFAIIIGGFESGQAAPNLAAINTAQVAAAAAFEVIDRTPAIDQAPLDEGSSPPPDKSVAGELSLNKVVFAYPTRPTVRVMDSTSLVIPAGKSMALVGSSGSGKSTIIQLLQRFYDPQEGSVMMDGTDLRSLNLRWVRRHMGLVSQEPALFSGTIRQNIAYGREDATQEEIEAAARAANAAGFIGQLPMGYETQTGERGVQLSGGQKQRVAIARAVLRNPRILLLDEATSALDSESERVVQAALDALIAAGGRTSIIIAHRLSTIRDADCITVLSKGLVVQQGTHAAMAADAGGAYAALLAAQQGQHFDEAGPAYVEAVPGRASMDGTRKSLDGKPVLEADIVHAEAPDADAGKDEFKDVKVPFTRLWKLGASRVHLLPIGVFGAMINGAIMPCFALALASIIAAFFLPPDGLREEVAKWCLIFLGISVGAFVAMVLQTWALGTIAAELARNARCEVFAAIVRMEASWFDRSENSSGRLASRLEEDTVHLRGAVGDNVAVAVQNLTVMAGGLAIAFAYSWKLTLVILACLPVLMAGAIVQMKVLMGGVGGENSKLYANANQMLSDALSNVRTVAAYGLSRNMVGLYTHAQEGPSEELRQRANINGFAFGFGQGMFVLLYALSFWYGGYLVDRGEVMPGDVFKTFFAVMFMGMGGAQASVAFPSLSKAGDAVKSVFGTIDRRSEVDPTSAEGTQLESLGGALELRDVVFCYPSRPSVTVLQSLNLVIPAGKSMALVGSSGSGKSTVIQMLQRFYDPASGAVLLDGTDLRQLNLKWLRAQMGLVSQEPALFSTSIGENIAYGREGATQEDIEAAARAANAADFIGRLPLGYGTACGERGVQLSGGQKQRIAIARAVLRNPRILLLDEATSALDSESERVVQAALDALIAAGGRTSIIIAHRLSTIRDADCITVLNKGEVVESGSHDQLLARASGKYAMLHRMQQGGQR